MPFEMTMEKLARDIAERVGDLISLNEPADLKSLALRLAMSDEDIEELIALLEDE